MNRLEVKHKIIEVLKELEVEENQLTPNSSFKKDLGFDSLDFVEMVLTMELEFNVSIWTKEIKAPLHTINDLVKIIELLLMQNKGEG